MLPLGERPSRERLEAMRDALMHRGPDGSGIEVLDNVGLVHTRLAIVDVSERAHQPMRSSDGLWWLSYNGEIFNHKAIRKELVGESFVSDGDTETLLHSLERWGTSVLPRLNGQFAFAAMDISAGRLLLARDRFGIKPLYLAYADDGIWFASEPAALLAAGIESAPRADSWRSIFDWSCYPGVTTLLRGIRRLSPGTCLEIDVSTSQLETHRWESAARHVSPERQAQLESSSRSSVVTELEGTLRAAVHDALLGDVPMGTLCSGGVDSSLLTAMAVEVKRDLIAFGASYKGDRGFDEGPAAQRVADALKIELDLLEVTKSGWREDFVGATLHFGAPLATASAVTISQMAQRAHGRGVKVLLTGEGADELFAGYNGIHVAALTAFLSRSQRATRNLERVALGHPLATFRSVSNLTKAALRQKSPVWSSVANPDIEETITPEPTGIGEPTGAVPPGDVTAQEEIEAAYGHHEGPRRVLETDLLRSLDYTLSHLLNRMDKNMMQVSVEARVPFLDPRVVEFALNLPLELKTTPWSKGILRDVARRLLPWTSAHRPKIYGMDFDAGAWIEEAANPDFLRRGVFRDVFAIPTRDFDALLGEVRVALRVRLWSAEVWCRSMFAGDSQAAIEKDLWPHGP